MSSEPGESISFEKLEEEVSFAMIERLNQLSRAFWENLRVSCLLESLAFSDVGGRVSANMTSLLSSFFMVKQLWVLECTEQCRAMSGSLFETGSGRAFNAFSIWT